MTVDGWGLPAGMGSGKKEEEEEEGGWLEKKYKSGTGN